MQRVRVSRRTRAGAPSRNSRVRAEPADIGQVLGMLNTLDAVASQPYVGGAGAEDGLPLPLRTAVKHGGWELSLICVRLSLVYGVIA